jgi:cellulose synthase/poly-beta-1,6-N-acetylglucosamine synthase-like glycosyltransferase
MAVPVTTILIETIGAIVLPERPFALATGKTVRNRVGVLVPAHNEEETLAETLATIKPQLRGGDWLLVVADNCSDSTAAIAEGLGADVIVRTDPLNIGKGFALDWGVRHFATNPPEIVIVVDADCRLREFAIDHLTEMCSTHHRPVQARYLMTNSPNSLPYAVFREFAWRVKNWIRPLGLSSARLPCQLMGTGMAFGWEVIATANLASGELVEDLKLGLELAASGHPPIFCPTAIVTSEFPATGDGRQSQQRRWEQGHIGMILASIPGFAVKGIRHGNLGLFVLALDAAVPPLSLLSLTLMLFLGLGLVFLCIGIGSAAFLVSLCNLAAFTCTAMLCWFKFGRDVLPLKLALWAVAVPLAKIPFYCRLLFKRNNYTWIRTDRRKL